jgi:hypothetical protein
MYAVTHTVTITDRATVLAGRPGRDSGPSEPGDLRGFGARLIGLPGGGAMAESTFGAGLGANRRAPGVCFETLAIGIRLTGQTYTI